MIAVIPAAGFASRLRPFTEHCHKTMLPLGNTTMMALILQNLHLNGVKEVVVITGYRYQNVMDYILSICDSLIIHFVYNPVYKETNNAYSLSLAKIFVEGKSFLLLDCDIVFEPDVLRRVIESPHDNVLAVQKRNNLGNEEMKAYSDDNETVIRLTKEGNPQKAIGESIGIEKFSPEFSKKLFDILPKRILEGRGRTEYYEDTFQQLIDEGEIIHMVDVSDCQVIEVDFIEDLKSAEQEILPFILTKLNRT
jgi:choline kinase